MSHAPSTFGTIITSSLWPISPTIWVMSSRTHGEASSLTRVQSWVSPRSMSLPTLIRPARAASLRSTGMASSRLPSRMSTVGAMSGTFATIFSLEKSRKWIIREGLTGISRSGSGASIASGLKKSLGLRIERRNLPVTRIPRPMSDSETRAIETNQADREASGARPYGRYLEDFEVGAVYKHWPAKTVTEADDHLFCLLTMNHHPLHINDVYAAASQQGRNVVVGPLVYSLAVGMTVSDVSGKAIANLATEDLSHPNPVFHGDTLYCESEVLEVRPSQSKPDRGVVKVHTRVFKQTGQLVAEFKRAVLVPRKDEAIATGEDNVD